jgi:cell division protein FtsX
MGIRDITKLMTRIAFLLGILAVLSCISVPFIFYGMLCSILGTVIAIIVISIRTHYSVPTTWKHPSIISLLLCSAPVLYFMILIFFHKA